MLDDGLAKTEALETGDPCEFRFPARSEWRPGTVSRNGRWSYWSVHDTETGMIVNGLHIEHVRAVGTNPWSGP